MKHECNNCGSIYEDENLPVDFEDIPDITQRIAPGEIVPSGECECGALTHLVEEETDGGPPVRILELAERLTAPGPKCSHLSASETHEIADWIRSLKGGMPRILCRIEGGILQDVVTDRPANYYHVDVDNIEAGDLVAEAIDQPMQTDVRSDFDALLAELREEFPHAKCPHCDRYTTVEVTDGSTQCGKCGEFFNADKKDGAK